MSLLEPLQPITLLLPLAPLGEHLLFPFAKFGKIKVHSGQVSSLNLHIESSRFEPSGLAPGAAPGITGEDNSEPGVLLLPPLPSPQDKLL